MSEIVSVRAVARAASVSPSCASAALRGLTTVNPATAKRIRDVADKLGYRPNPLLAAMLKPQSLSTTPSGPIIAWVHFTNQVQVTADQPERQRTLAQNNLIAAKYGYEFREVPIQDAQKHEQLARRLYHSGVEGIILEIANPARFKLDFKAPEWSRFAQVTLHKNYSHGPVCVTGNHVAILRMAWSHVFALGYKRIGVVLCHHPYELEDDRNRIGTLLELQASLDTTHEAVPPFLGGITDYADYLKWFLRYKPDAVIGFQTSHYYILKENGVRIPQDVGYAQLHWVENDEWATDIAGVAYGKQDVYESAIMHLDSMIRHGEKGAGNYRHDILTRPNWHTGTSLPEPG